MITVTRTGDAIVRKWADAKRSCREIEYTIRPRRRAHLGRSIKPPEALRKDGRGRSTRASGNMINQRSTSRSYREACQSSHDTEGERWRLKGKELSVHPYLPETSLDRSGWSESGEHVDALPRPTSTGLYVNPSNAQLGFILGLVTAYSTRTSNGLIKEVRTV